MLPEKIYPTRFALYYVTECGQVFREETGNFLEVKPFLRGGAKTSQYASVNVSLKNSEGKTVKQIRQYVHRMVAEALIENPHSLSEIDHIDRDKLNNSVDNLRWVSKKSNFHHRGVTRNSNGQIQRGS